MRPPSIEGNMPIWTYYAKENSDSPFFSDSLFIPTTPLIDQVNGLLLKLFQLVDRVTESKREVNF
jgi:hypothetical protein